MSDAQRYDNAVQIIKTAILRSQYRAAKSTNAEQLGLYYAIGKYVSSNTRSGQWGKGVLASISRQLQKELPGLRGFSERNLKYMRTFYEEWHECFEGSSEDAALTSAESETITVWHLQMPNLDDETQSAFMSIGFTHHRTILEKAKTFEERVFYIKLCAREYLNVEVLKRSIRNDDYHHRGEG